MAHLRWREERWRPGLPLSLLGFAVGLAAGEVALSVLAYLFAYELFAAPGTPKARVRALCPTALILIAYLLHYRLAGYGAAASGLYLDPFRSPLEYLAAAPTDKRAALKARGTRSLVSVTEAPVTQPPPSATWTSAPPRSDVRTTALMATPVVG